MLFSGDLLYINLFSVFTASLLGWYFGGADFYLHPDRFLASLVSYSEKSLYRKGDFREGVYALLTCMAAAAFVCAVILYFSAKAGGFWYFLISTAMVYLSINSRFSEIDSDSSAAVVYMSYAMPVIFYSTVFGPAAAVLYRLLPVMRSMLPANSDRYRNFGTATEQTYRFLRDMANLLIPGLVYSAGEIRRFIRYLKSYRP